MTKLADRSEPEELRKLEKGLLRGISRTNRRQVKQWLEELERLNPGTRSSMMAALGNVKVSHLYDPDLRAPCRNSQRGGGAEFDAERAAENAPGIEVQSTSYSVLGTDGRCLRVLRD